MLAGLLPLVATVMAFLLSVRLGLIPACNPFVDGCVSISRAARHDLPNILFRTLVLPAGVLQAWCWVLCPAWLRSIGAPRGRGLRTLPWLGAVAGICLVVYGSFLGTEGEGYRWMRRYGVAFYFGFTCIGMLITSGEMQRHLRGGQRTRQVTNTMLALCFALPLLGLVHVLLPLALPPDRHDALQNVTEWWAAAIFTLFFFVLAWAWQVTKFAASFGAARAER